ncbi:MAG: MATE family efflux transporter [Deltaproteobacteria bacterium]|nr:MATE family efflux transporter [Deltaproteobacteria bacterium]MBW2360581.1 MATE family efflux transporter [Deltaproteobacteria bacterium]
MSNHPEDTASDAHAFVARPHRTFALLSAPVLASLIVEPLTGLVDTAFVAQLGAVPLASLGAATQVLSSLFWIFNFLGIGTQTEVAQAAGRGDTRGGREAASLALGLAFLIGIAVALLGWLGTPAALAFMSDETPVRESMRSYLVIRLLGAPAVLVIFSGFGALRGLQQMRAPLWIAAGANLVNLVLDPLLIFGAGPVPAYGVAGAAAASVAGQWIGALWTLAAVRRLIGLSPRVPWQHAPALLVVGRDLFLRTGSLTLFLLFATRAATRLGADAGAAHQIVRQVWFFTAFLLDAYAAVAQSLVAGFLGGGHAALARRAARVAGQWAVATGVVLTGLMGLGQATVAAALVPSAALTFFPAAWWVLALAQPLNAIAFVTDGIHWGTRDYAYLRNAMFVATAAGLLGIASLPRTPDALVWIWLVTAGWISLRATFGVLRIWPGIGAAPLGD